MVTELDWLFQLREKVHGRKAIKDIDEIIDKELKQALQEAKKKKNREPIGAFRIVNKVTKKEVASNLTYINAVKRCNKDFEVIEAQRKTLDRK